MAHIRNYVCQSMSCLTDVGSVGSFRHLCYIRLTFALLGTGSSPAKNGVELLSVLAVCRFQVGLPAEDIVISHWMPFFLLSSFLCFEELDKKGNCAEC